MSWGASCKARHRRHAYRWRPIFLLVFSILLVAACTDMPSREPLPRGEAGLFWGGQVQRVRELEVKGREFPDFGFRLTFPPTEGPKFTRKVRVRFSGPGAAGRRTTREVILKIDSDRSLVEHRVEWPSSRRTGVYSIRVEEGPLLLIDRALVVRAVL
ncbi:MAG: hypothetical protein MK135_04030 [Polyangiaceae bacterium]|nr:hypothetical protein [Polyangiaceae bacterium]